jgi:hypothetical protein
MPLRIFLLFGCDLSGNQPIQETPATRNGFSRHTEADTAKMAASAAQVIVLSKTTPQRRFFSAAGSILPPPCTVLTECRKSPA